MAITLVGLGALSEWVTLTDSSTPIPSGTIAGDLMLMYVVGQLPLGGVPTWSVAGWTKRLATPGFPLASLGFEIFFKIAGPGEVSPLVTKTLGSPVGGSAAYIISYRGVDTVTPFDVVSAVGQNNPGFNPLTIISGITTLTPNALAIVAVATGDENSISQTTANGFTVRASGIAYNSSVGTFGGRSFAKSDKLLVIPGPSGAPQYTQTISGPDAWAIYNDALKEAAVAPTPSGLPKVSGGLRLDLGRMMGT